MMKKEEYKEAENNWVHGWPLLNDDDGCNRSSFFYLWLSPMHQCRAVFPMLSSPLSLSSSSTLLPACAI